MNIRDEIEKICFQSKKASHSLKLLNTETKNKALLLMADTLHKRQDEILQLNRQEVKKAKNNGLSSAFIDRMTLRVSDIKSLITNIKKIVSLADPVGQTLKAWEVDSGLNISSVSVPIGVLGIIYESRPNVTVDCAALCLKSGNTVVLRGGSACAHTNSTLVECLQSALAQAGLDPLIIQYIPIQEREAISVLVSMDKYVDVIIPRGGKELIQAIQESTRIPVFSHLNGLCHTYVHEEANLEMAVKIVVNAKMRRTGICGATETVLIDESIAKTYLPKLVNELTQMHCELRGDERSQNIDKRILPASQSDWDTEYLNATLSIKIVKDIEEAIEHIGKYGSDHTDAIVTENQAVAQQFLVCVDSANVMHNCSTQFADGGEFGMGAEIGIATGRLHARGPVGLEQLTTFKYIIRGEGQTRA